MDQQQKPKMTHSVMPKKLAEALMEAGVQHFDSGGSVPIPASGVGQPTGGQSATPTTQGTKNDYGQTARDWVTVNPRLLDDYGSMIKNIGTSMTPQSGFVAGAPNIQTQNFGPQIGGLQQRQQDVYNQQQNLAQALLAQSQGQGPNPAQAQLAQNTGNNVQQQAALIASQRGASANPALMARQAAMSGANVQQNSVGQAATLQAQQQIAAQQQLQQQYSGMAGNALQGESIQQGGIAAQNQSITQGQLGAQNINANTANANADRAGKGIGGLISGVGSALALSDGGEVPTGIQKYGGGDSGDIPQLDKPKEEKGGLLSSFLAKGGRVPGKPEVQGDSQKNDKVPALLSPGEVVIPRSIMDAEDAPEKAAEFIKHLQKNKKKGGYDAVAEARNTSKKMSKGGRVC